MAREKIKRTQAVADWPEILNKSQELLKPHVNDKGNGVFSFVQVFAGTQYQRQAPTICRYLQDLGVLIRGRRTPEGAFNWTLKPRKITVADVRKARAKRSTTGVKPAKKARTKTTTALAPALESPPIQASPKVSKVSKAPKKVALAESLPMLIEMVETLRKENTDLKSRIKELEAHSFSEEIAERVSQLICEYTTPKN